MSCTISISEAAEDVWMIRNAVFRWLKRILQAQFPNDAELTDRMQTAEYFGGISIELEQEQNPILADRIVKSLLSVSREIADGRHALHDDHGNPWPELQKQCEETFGDLCLILERWNTIKKTNRKPPTG